MSNYEVGGKYYLPVMVEGLHNGEWPVELKYSDWRNPGRIYLKDELGLLLTAEEVAQTFNDDQVDFWKRDSESAHAELENADKRIAELEGIIADRTMDVEHLSYTVSERNDTIAGLQARLEKQTDIAELKIANEMQSRKIIMQQEYIDMLKEHISVLVDNLKVVKYGGCETELHNAYR